MRSSLYRSLSIQKEAGTSRNTHFKTMNLRGNNCLTPLLGCSIKSIPWFQHQPSQDTDTAGWLLSWLYNSHKQPQPGPWTSITHHLYASQRHSNSPKSRNKNTFFHKAHNYFHYWLFNQLLSHESIKPCSSYQLEIVINDDECPSQVPRVQSIQFMT